MDVYLNISCLWQNANNTFLGTGEYFSLASTVQQYRTIYNCIALWKRHRARAADDNCYIVMPSLNLSMAFDIFASQSNV